MSSYQPQLDHLIAYWNIPCVITYPTPPYLTLRMNIGLHQGPPFPRLRLLHMTRKFSSAKVDRRHYKRVRDKGRKSLLPNGEFYRKTVTSHPSQISDEKNKWIIYNPLSGLKASFNQKANQVATFVITTYIGNSNQDKMAVTLKIVEPNLYLSCRNGKLILDDPNNNGETLDTIRDSTNQDSTSRFLFLRSRDEMNYVQFQSVISPGMFICTGSEGSLVKMSKPSNVNIFGFIIDAERMVENNGFSRQVPMGRRERLQEYNQLMANTYERFTYRPYGILCVGSLDI